MASETSLDRVQRWMQAVVVHPGTVEDAVAAPAAREALAEAGVDDVLRPSATLTPVERVGIYHGMYLLRMEEALATDYPGLKHFLGEAAFRELVGAYVQVHPSRHFSLNPLGDHLPDYVRDAASLRSAGFCYDLARLELAVTHVFDAPETAALSPEAIAAVPAQAWERARLTPIAAFRLLALQYPVGAYLDSLSEAAHSHPALRVKENWTVVYRREYAVRRLDLARPAYRLLADLAAGRPLGEAVQAALRRRGRTRLREEQLFGWFQEWAQGGLFAAVRTG